MISAAGVEAPVPTKATCEGETVRIEPIERKGVTKVRRMLWREMDATTSSPLPTETMTVSSSMGW